MQALLIKLRKSAGLSQEEMAQKLGMSRPTYILIEKGVRDLTVTELRKVAEVYDVPVEILLDEELSVGQKIDCMASDAKSGRRFENLMLECIKFGSDEDGKITKTKLAKLVYLCDFASYYNYLKPISGFEYRKLAQGPVAIEFFDMVDFNESVCVEQKDKAFMVSLVEHPDDSVFNKDELALIKAVCKKWKKASTNEIVDFTHKQMPWKVCKDREVIPYSLINNEAPENVY